VQDQRAVYHCITRVVGGMFLLESDEAKEVLRRRELRDRLIEELTTV